MGGMSGMMGGGLGSGMMSGAGMGAGMQQGGMGSQMGGAGSGGMGGSMTGYGSTGYGGSNTGTGMGRWLELTVCGVALVCVERSVHGGEAVLQVAVSHVRSCAWSGAALGWWGGLFCCWWHRGCTNAAPHTHEQSRREPNA